MPARPLVLLIIDGFGVSDIKIGNAVLMARKPTWDTLLADYPHTLLQASGEAVGMDWGESGNSEVGHLAIGSGRIVKHYSAIINSAIKDGSFSQNPALLGAIEHAQKQNSKLHLAGLLTSGAVHAHFDHLIALLDLVEKSNVSQICLHLFTDGKDGAAFESEQLLKHLSEHLKNSSKIKLVTMVGRDFAMARNLDWDRTKIAYDMLVNGVGEKVADLAVAVAEKHKQNISDAVMPALISGQVDSFTIAENDAIIFFNFREERMRQLTRAFGEPGFTNFPTKVFTNLFITTFTPYLENTNHHVAFFPPAVENNLPEVLSLNGKKQYHLAESEKAAHVTLFFNGLHNKSYTGEEDFIIDSPHDLAQEPQMRCAEIAQKAVEILATDQYDFMVINLANADMLSHLGDVNLTVKGVEFVDDALSTLYQAVKKAGGTLVVTADHGNAEAVVYSTSGEKETKHNNNPVPFCLVDENYRGQAWPDDVNGILADVAPTILELMGLATPNEMTGKSLLRLLKTK